MLVGGYRLLAKIGEGGMGVVHLARRGDGERVALKVLRPHVVGDEDGRARLEREVDSLSRVHSRWVAEIVDADPWAAVPWIATRYVPGLSLHDHVLEEGPVRGADLLWFAGCLAEGLDAVHAVGVLHRDVKPSNVLMEGRTPILIDFGLAKLADDPRMTQAGWLIGTPGYLAPEILHGDDATEASDVHAWAATVAYAGTGRAPFGRGPSAAVMDRVRRGEHDLSGLTGDLARVVAAALDPEPENRPELWEVLDWLRPQTTRVRRVVPPPPVPLERHERSEPDETHPWQPAATPYDVTAVAGAEDPTDRWEGERPHEPVDGTRVLPWDGGGSTSGARSPLVGRPAAAARCPVRPPPLDPLDAGAAAVVPRARAGRGAALLRRRPRCPLDAGGDRRGAGRLAVVGPGRQPGALTGRPGGPAAVEHARGVGALDGARDGHGRGSGVPRPRRRGLGAAGRPAVRGRVDPRPAALSARRPGRMLGHPSYDEGVRGSLGDVQHHRIIIR